MLCILSSNPGRLSVLIYYCVIHFRINRCIWPNFHPRPWIIRPHLIINWQISTNQQLIIRFNTLYRAHWFNTIYTRGALAQVRIIKNPINTSTELYKQSWNCTTSMKSITILSNNCPKLQYQTPLNRKSWPNCQILVCVIPWGLSPFNST